jgi:hypothetical protein
VGTERPLRRIPVARINLFDLPVEIESSRQEIGEG